MYAVGTVLEVVPPLPKLSDGSDDPWQRVKVVGVYTTNPEVGEEPVIQPVDGFRHYPEEDDVNDTPKVVSPQVLMSVGYRVVTEGDGGPKFETPLSEIGG